MPKMPDRKRVLFIAPQPFFESRGTPMNVRAMLETLASSGRYEVELLAFPFGTDVSLPGVEVHRCWSPPFIRSIPVGPSFRKLALDLCLCVKARRLCMHRDYDLYHGIEEGAFIAARLAKRSAKAFICDVDSCMQTQLSESSIIGTTLAARVFSFLENRAMQKATAVLTVCTALTEKVKKIAPRVLVSQIEDFPAEGSSTADPQTLEGIRGELASSAPELRLVYTGNFERYQGLDLLFESLAKLQNPGIELLLVGGGGPGATQYEQYRAKATELGLDDQIRFFGNRPQSEMGAFMQIADVLVSPRTEGENTPLKLYSYMASGTPILATDIYSHTQVLSEETAYLGAANIEGFSAALAAVTCLSAEAREERTLRAKRARDLVEQRYSRAAFEQRLLSLYQTVLPSEVIPEGERQQEEVERMERSSYAGQ